MKSFCLDLKEHALKIIDYEKKEIIPLTNEERKLHREQNVCYICKNNLVLMIKHTKRLEIIFLTLEKIEKLLMIFAI